MLGGMSWESTVEYYSLLNRACARTAAGEQHSRRPDRALQRGLRGHRVRTASGRLGQAARVLADGARRSTRGGRAGPALHEHDAQGFRTGPGRRRHSLPPPRRRHGGPHQAGPAGPGRALHPVHDGARILQGTARGRFNATVIVPDEEDRERVHRIIYDELCKGIFTAESRSSLGGIMGRRGQEAEAVVLGCTELGLLVGDSDPGLPVLDTTRIHVEAAFPDGPPPKDPESARLSERAMRGNVRVDQAGPRRLPRDQEYLAGEALLSRTWQSAPSPSQAGAALRVVHAVHDTPPSFITHRSLSITTLMSASGSPSTASRSA